MVAELARVTAVVLVNEFLTSRRCPHCRCEGHEVGIMFIVVACTIIFSTRAVVVFPPLLIIIQTAAVDSESR